MAMTRSLRSTGITPLHHYKETDSPPQLDSDEAAMTYERFIRCGSAKPVANYYATETQTAKIGNLVAAKTPGARGSRLPFPRCASKCAGLTSNYQGIFLTNVIQNAPVRLRTSHSSQLPAAYRG